MPISGLEIKPHQVSPLLATPRTLALAFAGAATYLGFIDPKVRNALEGTKNKLQHWATMYTESIGPMSSIALIAGVFSGLCYWKTQEKLWILGGALMTGLWPYTYLVLMPTNKELLHHNKTLKTETEVVSSGENDTILAKLSSWVTGHRGRALIALVAAAVFYVAELKSTETVKVAVNLK